MSRIREKNGNTVAAWNALHSNEARMHNGSIVEQFKRFFSFDLLPKDESISVLDVGCSEAVHFDECKKLYPKVDFCGLDFSSAVIDKNNKFHKSGKYILCDLNVDTIQETYDYIVSMHTFEHLEDPVKVLSNCVDRARKNVYICVPFERNWSSDDMHLHTFTAQEPFTEYEKIVMFNDQEMVFVFKGKAK
jgi:2-polyprenyl-3-methyl-5-hydroxy-6-metoxy-1,4-benzoquinol methylase